MRYNADIQQMRLMVFQVRGGSSCLVVKGKGGANPRIPRDGMRARGKGRGGLVVDRTCTLQCTYCATRTFADCFEIASDIYMHDYEVQRTWPSRDAVWRYRGRGGWTPRLVRDGDEARIIELLAQLQGSMISSRIVGSNRLEIVTTYILTLRSSPALAKMPGMVGCQATALTVPAPRASSAATCTPVWRRQM